MREIEEEKEEEEEEVIEERIKCVRLREERSKGDRKRGVSGTRGVTIL